MEPEKLLEEAKRRAERAEIFFLKETKVTASFEANRLKQIRRREIKGVSLRVINEGRMGFAAARGEAGGEIVEKALQASLMGPPANFSFPAERAFPNVAVFDPSLEALPEEELVKLGLEAIEQIREKEPAIVCEGSTSWSLLEIGILNSEGGEAFYRKTLLSGAMEGILVRDEDMLFVGDSQSSCSRFQDLSEMARSICEQLERAKKIVPAPSGPASVLFTPLGVASALVLPLALALNGKNVFHGSSPLAGRLGEEVFSPLLSAWDEPLADFRPGSRPCDDEGTPSRKIALIERGAVRNFVYDLQTAALAGAETTGSASRSLTEPPSPEISVLRIAPGDKSFREMLAEMREGFVVEELMGASQANVMGGEISGNILLGYRVEGGEIAGRVKNAMLHGNIYTALRRIIAISREARWVGGDLHLPYILCEGLNISLRG